MEQAKSARPKILLAEDEEHIAKLIVFKLNREGYDVSVAQNGREALELFEKDEYKLLILDVMMPLVDGMEVLKRVRATARPSAHVPILMLTAKGRQSDAAQAADLGATQFLRKPFDPAELASIVGALVNR